MNAETPFAISSRHQPRLAGEAGVWVFIGGDFLLFGLLFLTYAYYRALNPVPFIAGAQSQNLMIGLANTLLLLTGSWCVANAVEAARRGAKGEARWLIGAGMASGIGFIMLKAVEWSAKFGQGVTVLTNDYYMYYFMLTGIHLLHVVAGVGVLTFLLIHMGRARSAIVDRSLVESCGLLWHLVDLLWIPLFALLYLMR